MSAPIEPTGVLGALGINWKLFVMQLANFAIVAFAVWKLAYKPLLAKMDEREKKISDGLAFSENAEKKMEEMKKEKAAIVRQAKAEAHQIIEQAGDRALALQNQQVEKTKDELEKLREEHAKRLEDERADAFNKLKKEVAEIVSEGVKKILTGTDEEMSRQLIKKGMEEMDKS